MSIFKKVKIVGLVFMLSFMVAVTLWTQKASAVPMLELSSGATTVTISDGELGDINSAAGAITFNGSIENFILNVTTGITKPIIGSAIDPEIDLNSVDVSSTGGTLTIKFTDTDFLGEYSSSITSIGGVTNGNVSLESYLDDTNTPFGTGTLLANTGSLTGAFSNTTSSSFASPAIPYSLTLVASIIHPSTSTSITSFNANVSVPEPSTLLLLGSGLLGIGILGRKATRKGTGRN